MSKLPRREFIIGFGSKVGAVSAAAALAPESLASTIEASAKIQRLSIMQGYTDESSTEINALSLRRGLKFVLVETTTNRRIQPTWKKTFTRRDSEGYVEKMVFSDMVLGPVYRLEVYDKNNKLTDLRYLSALDLGKKNPRIAVISCINDLFLTSRAEKIWKTFTWTSCDLAFFNGDAVYADSIFQSIGKKAASPKRVWRRFVETRCRVPFYFSEKLTPVLAVWDDHDYGMNNGHAGRPNKQEVIDIFETFFGQSWETEYYKKGPGVSSVLHAFGHSFFLLDGRSQRTSRCPFENKMLNWMKANLKSDKRPTWLISGIQFFGDYHDNESFSGTYKERFKYFKNFLKSLPHKFVFVSGDIHYSEIQNIKPEELGYQTYEITSSCMHSLSLPSFPDKWFNKRRIYSSGRWNFVWMDLISTAANLNIYITVQGADYNPLWRSVLNIPLATPEPDVTDSAPQLAAVKTL